ncbi:uncharacterized protein LOC128740574 [Sabethes cyaneus]|uniref:uncharacterized protein LOC128740574 n=1 Tax=Sabethes cyaneus TaxID=53552 RepID=UPI00237DADC9|nr:uncharacterized protein LOC128740574 [Sabethes cyaneus]
MAINDVQQLKGNPFAAQLVKTLTDRLVKLKESQAFQMCLYIDPRLNFLNSKLFTNDEKQLIQVCWVTTWNRISKLKPSPLSSLMAESEANSSQVDDVITELFGGTLSKTDNDNESSFVQQLKALDAEPRQSHTSDIFQHWLKRRESHPELFEVAMVVLATPSNQVSVERAFSALALVLSPHRTGLGQDTLENILLIKLNRDIFQKIPSYEWMDLKE